MVIPSGMKTNLIGLQYRCFPSAYNKVRKNR